MKKITLGRNGQTSAHDVERSDRKSGQLAVGERVMLRIKGECCTKGSPYREYEVVSVVSVDCFGGRDSVTFKAVKAKGGKA